MNMIAFLFVTIQAGTPLLFATLGEILTERVGNLNLGVEGMMLMGSVMGFIVGYNTGNPMLALLAAAISGALGALIYAFLTVTLKTNQVVTGLTLTIFGGGFASFIGKNMVGKKLPDGINMFFERIQLPLLKDIPVIGEIFFKQDVFIYLGYITVILLWILLFKTNMGLNLRMVGENPGAADASGINILKYKYGFILLGGALCGLGGAYLSLVYVPVWQENITSGAGWIAVALVIFSLWNPLRAIGGAYFFGGLSIIGFRLQKFDLPISTYLLDMLPYLATILVLIFMSVKKSKENKAPKELGNPYFREER
ncbi:MAG: ABC transporter permease [Eubacteriales bacterium]